MPKKLAKPKRGESKIKIAKKKGKRDNRTEQETQQEAKSPASERTTKKRTETAKTWPTGDISNAKKPAITNSAKWE